jgi:hypothetical protein
MKLNKVLKSVILVAFITCSTFCMAQKPDLSRLITAIATVESKLNEKAVSRDCVGYLQIRPILVKECNIILKQQKKKTRYTLRDRFNKKKSIEMFYIIQKKYNPSFNIERALWIWNAGPYSKKKPISYIRKILKIYNKAK